MSYSFNIPFKVERGGGAPTARDYVQDGLIALWDGKENAGWGVHDGSLSVWTNLVDAGADMVLSATKASWGDDCLVCINGETDRTNSPCASVAKVYDSSVVLEAVVKLTSRWSGFNSASAGYKTNQTVFRSGRTGTGSGSRGFEITLPLIDGIATEFVSVCSVNDNYSFGVARFSEFFGKRSTVSRYPRDQVGYINAMEKTSESSIRSASLGASTLVGNISGEVCSLRVYNRALTADEISANYAVDKIRFNLP